MGYEARPGSGALFKNDKQGNDRAPDYKGDITLLDGSKARIAAWIKDGRNGKFMSLKLEEPREGSFPAGDRGADRGVSGGDRDGAGGGYRDLDDDLPF